VIERGSRVSQAFGWYDLVVIAESDSTFRYETGEESRTDPAIAAGTKQAN